MTTPSPRPWHAMPVEEIAAVLETGPNGLGSDQVAERLERFGPNAVPDAPRSGLFAMLLDQFRSPLVLILIIAGIATLILGEYVDSAAITAVVVLNATIGFIQERRAEHSVQALMNLLVQQSRVIRDGEPREIPSTDIVPGDLVVLESGVRIPADLRLVSTSALVTDEALLTGESIPVIKRTDPIGSGIPVADRANIAFGGTIVASGRGRGYVIATGEQTQIGAIAIEMRDVTHARTPLERRLSGFSRLAGIIAAGAAAAVFLVGILIGEPPSQMFTTAVAMAVATVPEGLPVALTIAMVIGVRRMARKQVIVRTLPAVEALGSTTVIGSDKTGTLTLNQLAVQEIWTSTGPISLDPASPGEPDNLAETARLTLIAAVLTNEATITGAPGHYEFTGDPTETALLSAAIASGLDPGQIRDDYHVHAEIPFESERQYSATIGRHAGEQVIFVKGAPERVLAMSTHILTPDGVLPIDRDRVHGVANMMAARGLRVLAMAWRPGHEPALDRHPVADPADLILLGLQGMADTIRPGVREAIAECRTAGIRVIMITGDHAVTAHAVATELGICAESDPVLTGADLYELEESQVHPALQSVSVFARIAPEQKLLIVQSLQDQGEIVAITGDGVNDAPALRAANVGVAMGLRGTDVAREAADMVLVDDNFVSITSAIREGRTTLTNVRNATFFLLSTNGGELLMILFALGLRWDLPLLAAQILWLNLVTDSVQVMGLTCEPGAPDTMRRRPRPLNEGLLPRVLWERVGISGLVMALVTLALFWWEREQGSSLAIARTIALTTLILFQTFQVANARSAERSLFRMNLLANPVVLAAALGALALHAVSLYLPPTQYLLRVEPISLEAWLRCVVCAASILIVVEVHKRLRSRLMTSPA